MRPGLQRRARGPTPFSSPEPPDFLGSVASPGRAPAPLRANKQDTSANLALRPAPPRLQRQLGRYQLIGGMGWRGGGASQARVERARTCTSPGCKASQAGCAVLFGGVGAAGSSAPVLPGSPRAGFAVVCSGCRVRVPHRTPSVRRRWLWPGQAVAAAATAEAALARWRSPGLPLSRTWGCSWKSYAG